MSRRLISINTSAVVSIHHMQTCMPTLTQTVAVERYFKIDMINPFPLLSTMYPFKQIKLKISFDDVPIQADRVKKYLSSMHCKV